MRNEILYSESEIKARKALESKSNNVSIEPTKVVKSKYNQVKNLGVQEIFIFKSADKSQNLETQLQGINDYDLVFMRFF